jgi:hypothetical protein
MAAGTGSADSEADSVAEEVDVGAVVPGCVGGVVEALLVVLPAQAPTAINNVAAASAVEAALRGNRGRPRLGCVTGTSGLATKILDVGNTVSLQTSQF